MITNSVSTHLKSSEYDHMTSDSHSGSHHHHGSSIEVDTWQDIGQSREFRSDANSIPVDASAHESFDLCVSEDLGGLWIV